MASDAASGDRASMGFAKSNARRRRVIARSSQTGNMGKLRRSSESNSSFATSKIDWSLGQDRRKSSPAWAAATSTAPP